jgi:hypothetical protein
MKKTLLLLCAALSLFAGSAFAMGVEPNGDGIVMAQPSAPPVMGSPMMAAAPPLSERLCPQPSLIYAYMTSDKLSTGSGHNASASPVAYDTGDPKQGTQLLVA